MPRASISERLLALFTPRERAAANVGDLLELHPGHAAFSLAVARMLLAMSWRLGLGFLAAAFVYSMTALGNWAARPPHGVDRAAIFSAWGFTLFASRVRLALHCVGF